MTEQEMRKGGGGKLSRSETVTVRLDPKLRYLAELAARLHRRTLSSYIEWSIKASLDTEAVRPTNMPSLHVGDHTIGNEAEYLWDVDEADRFAKLALRYPHLLTHEEQIRWKRICECPGFWSDVSPNFQRLELEWSVSEATMDFAALRRYWREVCAVADGTEPLNSLPPRIWDRSLATLGYEPSQLQDSDELPDTEV